MELGMVGLGRMDASLVRRLMRDGHTVIVYDVDPAAVAELVADGAIGASDVEDLAARLTGPRAIWVMVPAAIAGRVIDDVAAHLDEGDIVVDGGNSFYQDDQHRSAALAERGIHLLDTGTSGGIFGLPAIAQVWRRGSVIASWLLDLTAAALDRSPVLSEYSGTVSDSGEGRWTVLSTVQEGVPAPVLSAALYARFDSRGRDEFANQVLSAMRHQFGGHAERTEAP